MLLENQADGGKELVGSLDDLAIKLREMSMDVSILQKRDGETDDEFDKRLLEEQASLVSKADLLDIELDLLFKKDFIERTNEFETAYEKLKTVTVEISDELERQEKLVAKMRQLNQFLKLVDQGIEIAAGLAKSM